MIVIHLGDESGFEAIPRHCLDCAHSPATLEASSFPDPIR